MTETPALPITEMDPLARMIADCAAIRLVPAVHPVVDLTLPRQRVAPPAVIDITDTAMALAGSFSDYGA